MPAAWIGAGAAALGVGSSLMGGSGGSTTSSGTSMISPTMNGLLFGDTTNPGGFVNNSIANLEYVPQNSAMSNFGTGAENYMGSSGLNQITNALSTANGMLGFDQPTPQMDNASMTAANMNAASMQGAQMNAPAQNNMNLTGTYNTMLSGASGNNPYLSGSIQQGINQANDAYANTMTNTNNNMLQNILPAINSGAEMAGGYGGSRQGIAQGNAIGDMGTAQAQAASQMGMNNQDAAANAEAGTYMQGQANSLSALENLSGSQYGAATTNAGLAEQTGLANSGYQQQANLTNATNQQQAGLTNANLLQETGQANLAADQTTQSLNSANALGAMSQIGNLTGSLYNYGTAQNAYPYWQTQQVTNMLSPFSGLGGSTSQTTPYYTNPVGSAVGAATTGLGLYNAYKNANGSANNGASGLVGGVSALNVANGSSDPIGSLIGGQGW